MDAARLDDFTDLTAWSAVTSGLAELAISSEPGPQGWAMRLDFDFKGGGGFVVARRAVAIVFPEAFVLTLDIRGAAPPNRLELKLCDPSGRNVWWYRRDGFEFPTDWQPLRISSREIEFAWGPSGGGSIAEVGAIELAIAAPMGGKGTIWIADLRLEDRSFRGVPAVRASSALAGHGPESALNPACETGWQTKPGDLTPWIEIDFGQEREYGGLIIDWVPGGAPRSFEVQTGADRESWTTAYSARQVGSKRSYVYLPGTVSRCLRLNLIPVTSRRGVGIKRIEVKPYDFSRSIDLFFHNVAADEPRGFYPRHLCREQTYWSPVGIPDGDTCALLNEEGMVEVDRGSFSVEPFLFTDGRLITWADVATAQQLERGYLPIPSSVWRTKDFTLTTTAFAIRHTGKPVLFIRYRIETTDSLSRNVRLFAALRPFQVTPSWQAYRGLGGVSPIRELERAATKAVWVNGSKVVVSLTEPSCFGGGSFDEGAIAALLCEGSPPERDKIGDSFGCASAALGYDLQLAPGSASEVYLAVPFGTERGTLEELAKSLPAVEGAGQLEAAARMWESRLGAAEIRLPASAQAVTDTLRTAAAHILISRDGPALQPGPRRYTRSWIRDGAIMGAALLRMGWTDEVRDFTRWYARYQREDGFVPCCVDRDGPDWLVEHDSHGQLIYAVMDYFRFTGDRTFLVEMWPAVRKAVGCIEALRQTRLTPEFQTPEKRACYGLLPESASHEGYLAHPLHSYWDDFWALRGLKDAAAMADLVGDTAAAERIAAQRDDLAAALYDSIRMTIAGRGLDYIPGSVEWADFDPTATAYAISLLDAAEKLPPGPLRRTFEEYLTGFRRKHTGQIDWINYSAYEIRIIGALVRLGERASANELLDFFLSDRRPLVWNQWPEISWRDPRSPGHLGDLPHCWIGAEYILAFRTMLVFEREPDRALVIGAGVRPEWLEGDGVTVKDLPTYYGALSFTLRRSSTNTVSFTLAGDVDAAIILRPPLPGPLRSLTIDGKAVDALDGESAWVGPGAREVELRTG